MENYALLILPLFLLCVLIRMILLPMKLGWKLLINSLCGFLCLWILNSLSPFTGFRFPINIVTALTAGFLGLPGICLWAILQFFL